MIKIIRTSLNRRWSFWSGLVGLALILSASLVFNLSQALAYNWSAPTIVGDAPFFGPNIAVQPRTTGRAAIVTGGYAGQLFISKANNVGGPVGVVSTDKSVPNDRGRQVYRPDGRGFIVWQSRQAGTGYQTFIRVVGPDGNYLTQPKPIGQNFGNGNEFVVSDVAYSKATGKTYITMQVNSNPPSWGFAELDDNGNLFNQRIIVSGRPPGDLIQPAICVDNNDNIFMAGLWNSSVATIHRVNGVWSSLNIVASAGGIFGSYGFRGEPTIACSDNGYAYAAFDGPKSAVVARYSPTSGWALANLDVAPGTDASKVNVTVANNQLVLALGYGRVASAVTSDNPETGMNFSAPETVVSRNGANVSGLDVAFDPVTSIVHYVVTYDSYETYYSSATIIRPAAAPTNANIGVVSSSQINISWVDNSNNETGFIIERQVEGGAFQTLTTTAPNATFYSDTGLEMDTTYGYRVRAVNTNYPADPLNPSAATNVVSGKTLKPVYLVWQAAPTQADPGVAFSTQPVLSVRDANYNYVTNYQGNVSLSLTNNPAGGSLSGTNTVAFVNGIATFSGLSVNKIGPTYQLTATTIPAAGTKSANFVLTQAGPGFNVTGRLVITSAAIPNVKANSQTPFSVTVKAVKSSDNDAAPPVAFDGPVTLKIANGTGTNGATLSGNPFDGGSNTLTGNASNGQITFTNLKLDKLGTNFQLVASSSYPVTSATTNPFNVTANLVVNGPANTQVFQAFQVTVDVNDDGNQKLTYYNGTVTLSGSGLQGQTTVNAVGGTATFNGLYYESNNPSPQTITATIANLPGQASQNFNIAVGAPGGCINTVVTIPQYDGQEDTGGNCNISLQGALSRLGGGQAVRFDKNRLSASAGGSPSLPQITNLPASLNLSGKGIDAGCTASGPAVRFVVTGLTLDWTLNGTFLRGIELNGSRLSLGASGGGVPNTLSCMREVR